MKNPRPTQPLKRIAMVLFCATFAVLAPTLSAHVIRGLELPGTPAGFSLLSPLNGEWELVEDVRVQLPGH